MKKLLLLLTCITFTSSLSAFAQNKSSPYFFGVDIRDMASYSKELIPEVNSLLENLQYSLELFFPKNVKFNPNGVHFQKTKTRLSFLKNKVFSFVMTEGPYDHPFSQTSELHWSALYHSKKWNEFAFRKFKLTFDLNTYELLDIQIKNEIPLSEISFRADVNLLERKIVLSNQKHNLFIVYPLSVGAFDEKVRNSSTVLMTPVFEWAEVRKKNVISSRTIPDYYKARPFLRISTPKEDWTAYGFHTIMNPNLVRGFDSHGCMRLRDKDLYEFYVIVMNQFDDFIPVYFYQYEESKNELPHPYPMTDEYYNRIKNYGTKENPIAKRVSGLTVLERVNADPPTNRLIQTHGEN